MKGAGEKTSELLTVVVGAMNESKGQRCRRPVFWDAIQENLENLMVKVSPKLTEAAYAKERERERTHFLAREIASAKVLRQERILV